MGDGAKESNVFAFLSALEMILPSQGYEVAYGSGMAAAQRSLASFSPASSGEQA
jgi:aspartate aminotransferase-like enzyme